MVLEDFQNGFGKKFHFILLKYKKKNIWDPVDSLQILENNILFRGFFPWIWEIFKTFDFQKKKSTDRLQSLD